MQANSQVRKGDVVAIERTHTTVYASFARPSETRAEWLLATVASATRDGIAKSVVLAGVTYAQKLEHMTGRPRVHAISRPDCQAAARAIVANADPCLCWDTVDALRADILAKVSA